MTEDQNAAILSAVLSALADSRHASTLRIEREIGHRAYEEIIQILTPRATASPTPDTGSEEGSNHE